MRGFLGFLFANLFLLAIILIAAGLGAGGAWVINHFPYKDPLAMMWVGVVCVAVALLGTWFFGGRLHRFIERRVNRGTRS